MAKAYVLVVDDDKGIRETLKVILEENGYKVDMAKSGKEAIEKSKKNYYDLALLDIKLPDMEGTELLRKMRDFVPKMVKIMVTGHATLQNAVDSLNYGADAYIMKPVNPEELLSVIEKKLDERKQAEKVTEEKVVKWIETRVSKALAEESPHEEQK
ncbi:MAG: response regulator [Candidatus Bathyarchaeota archaeon]|nr:response regulator [Candidatus Bathyarchaeota archaeon]MCX8177011.1 response regulator [Candidatus Bathyarchaeota archaeon]MDW8194409.1 response regulator [Nitrososphaerota archaeon]